MKIIVSKDIVKLNENHSENHYGEYNVNECVFEFDEYFDSVPIKKAIFTSQSNNKSFEIDIINNKCTVPHEVLTKVYDTVILGVYGYDVNEETLLVRYSPEPTTFVVHEGSYKEGAEQPEIITPTQYDMYSKALQEGLTEVDKRLDDVEKQGDYASEQGNYAKEQGDYAKEQGTNAKSVAEETEKKAEEGKFNGKSLEFVWEGTKLGVRLEGQEEYHFVDLQGKQGEIGATGEPFKIKKTYASVSEMNADFRNMEFGDYVMIASSVEVEDNAKLYTKGESAWIFISDFSGAMGIRGETGLTPNIKIGEVKTLEAGSQAKVTRSGSNEEPVFNFELPKGDKGDNYVLTEEDKVEIGEKVNTEYEKRIEQNEKYISDLEATIDILTNTNTAKGELVHITDALPLPVFETSADGNVEQFTTRGVNLYETIINTNQSALNGLTVTQNNDGSVNVQGTGTTNWSNITISTPIKIEPNVDYCFSINKATNYRPTLKITFEDGSQNNVYIYSGETYKKFQVTQNVKDVYAYIYDANNFSNINETFYFQVEKGSTPTNYEPFTNGASPNPDYQQPIEVLEGYNLFNHNVVAHHCIVDSKTGEITITADTTDIYIQGAFAYNEINKFMTLEKGSYCIGSTNPNVRVTMYSDGLALDTGGTQSVVLSSITNFCGIRIRSIDGKTLLNQKFKVVINKGTNLKPYLPYGCVGYKVNGKNLLNLDVPQILNVTHNDDGTITLNGKGNNNLWYNRIWFKTNKKYYVKVELVSGEITGVNDSGIMNPPGTNFLQLNTFNEFSFTEDTSKQTMWTHAQAVYNNARLKIWISDEQTDFEPYKEQITYLDLKGNFVGAINDTIKDYLVTDKKKYWLVKNVGKVVLDGSENWQVNTSWDRTNTKCFLYNSGIRKSNLLSNYFRHNSLTYDKDISGLMGIVWETYLLLRIDKTLVNDLSTFKSWLSTHNTIVYYQLETPQIIELGELPEPIKTFEGVNNIQLLANLDTEIEVKYALDVKKYYDNKLAEISAQII